MLRLTQIFYFQTLYHNRRQGPKTIARLPGTAATVPVIVRHPDEGCIAIGFIMRQSGRKWRVEDVIMDGVSMRANLRNRFYQLLKKEGDFGHVQRMRGRLEKARQGD